MFQAPSCSSCAVRVVHLRVARAATIGDRHAAVRAAVEICGVAVELLAAERLAY